jgi:diguanylate cyclase (GGDEF)-like protein
VYIDLNEFKLINDRYGHTIGDRAFQEVAFVLKKNLRKNDMVIRSGGDKFLVLLADISAVNDVQMVISKQTMLCMQKSITRLIRLEVRL